MRCPQCHTHSMTTHEQSNSLNSLAANIAGIKWDGGYTVFPDSILNGI